MTNENFPSYLGYGLLKRDSYRKEAEKEFLEYSYNGQTVLAIELSPSGAMVEEYYNGKGTSMSFGKDLKGAVFQHYLASDQMSNPLHLEWIREVVSIGNIYAEMIQKSNQTVLYFPAVYLIDIKIPISDDKIPILEKFITDEEVIKLKPAVQKATIITRYEDRNENLTVSLLSICTPIAFTLQTLKRIKEAGLISSEKRLRGIVGLSKASNGTMMRNFFGSPSDDWKSYSIVYQNTL